ncbi:universal stress protein [Kurthia zopfii]|uniref:Nucleotide-binding universal stress UspA family protein n=1 Tax=Kurthia zopfii TaxID=1650 RepID=A0A2U3A9J4_9BACL|nr:universal stress protein [Kurthia zopfii]PWI21209.1 universal stress protein [Kurthia zopfii]TDR33509.1 nucleotide-binding universal stress UspA family protein [Kurthia zopfii]STX11227.1 Universal stress protein Rv1636/MT1672 [Kurthia zopfii]VEI05418.1 Universal stress protein Rv1636/MT1672 [Kurthia zopfii]GEK32279.1 universal stress protein [Kurthia zopfii]
MYKHILLAVDGSENSVRAAKEAVKIATEESLIEMVYVADFEKAKTEVLQAASSESLLLERKRKVAPIEEVLKETGKNYKLTILHGTPGPEIVKYANEKQVDVVVIGSRGLNGLQEMVLGSVSHKVMKRVQCPALIVK